MGSKDILFQSEKSSVSTHPCRFSSFSSQKSYLKIACQFCELLFSSSSSSSPLCFLVQVQGNLLSRRMWCDANIVFYICSHCLCVQIYKNKYSEGRRSQTHLFRCSKMIGQWSERAKRDGQCQLTFMDCCCITCPPNSFQPPMPRLAGP